MTLILVVFVRHHCGRNAHLVLSEVDLSWLASRSRVLKSASQLTTI